MTSDNSQYVMYQVQYFRTTFSNEWDEKKDGNFNLIRKPNISPQLFNIILMYSGLKKVYNRSKEEKVLNIICKYFLAEGEASNGVSLVHIRSIVVMDRKLFANLFLYILTFLLLFSC